MHHPAESRGEWGEGARCNLVSNQFATRVDETDPNDTQRKSRRLVRLLYRDCLDWINLMYRPTSKDSNTRKEQVSGSSQLVGSVQAV
jgi:hypothetical protein